MESSFKKAKRAAQHPHWKKEGRREEERKEGRESGRKEEREEGRQEGREGSREEGKRYREGLEGRSTFKPVSDGEARALCPLSSNVSPDNCYVPPVLYFS